MEIENFTYPEALRHAAKKYGIEIEEDQIEYSEEQKKRKQNANFYIKFMMLPIIFIKKFFGKMRKEKPLVCLISKNVSCTMTLLRSFSLVILQKKRCFYKICYRKRLRKRNFRKIWDFHLSRKYSDRN